MNHGRAMMLRGAAICLSSYLYGSLPVVYLLGRRRGVRLTRSGSGNVGSVNLWASTGVAYAAVGWIADASKGLLPAAVCRRLGYGDELAGLAGVCGVAGQCWPLFLRFNGGRGISAFVGAAFMIDRARWAIALLPLIAGALWRAAPALARRRRETGVELRASRGKSVPLGCAVGVVTFAGAAWVTPSGRRGPVLASALLAAVILLRRLTAPLPDDTTQGPWIRRSALLYRLLYDRNTSH